MAASGRLGRKIRAMFARLRYGRSFSQPAEEAARRRSIHPAVLALGIAAIIGTWFLLGKVRRISRGGFYVGPRE